MSSQENTAINVAIVGTAGVPASYGGFETLVENLCRYHSSEKLSVNLTVYCSGVHYKNEQPTSYLNAKLKYVNLKANGIGSVLYDTVSLMHAIRTGADVILILGVSGAWCIPLIRAFSKAKVITNLDGVEWKRAKWGRAARWFLRTSEWIAAKCSSVTICDNQAITDFVRLTYKVEPKTIAYGGDHAITTIADEFALFELPTKFAFSVCRIEPENNVHVILEAFSQVNDFPLVFVGNWNNSEYGRALKKQYADFAQLFLLDPIYDVAILGALRAKCALYVHGHSAGGTNPSLVEAMFFGRPIYAYDCSYNRVTTAESALYFTSSTDLRERLQNLNAIEDIEPVGRAMANLAEAHYKWRDIANDYFATIFKCVSKAAPASTLLDYTDENKPALE